MSYISNTIIYTCRITALKNLAIIIFIACFSPEWNALIRGCRNTCKSAVTLLILNGCDRKSLTLWSNYCVIVMSVSCNFCSIHSKKSLFMYPEVRLPEATIDISFDIKIFRYRDSIDCNINDLKFWKKHILAYRSPCDELYNFLSDMVENKFSAAVFYHYPHMNFDVKWRKYDVHEYTMYFNFYANVNI